MSVDGDEETDKVRVLREGDTCTQQKWSVLLSIASLAATWAHEELPPASIAGAEQPKEGEESYVQRHMASEHHIGAFDLGSFFSLHDLNGDGVLDVSAVTVKSRETRLTCISASQ